MMLATIDTNVLIRFFVEDDPEQSQLAAEILESAEIIAISLQALCEFAWVLNSHYKASRADISASISQLLGTANVVVNRPAVEAGLAVLNSGGDFADGVIAYEGQWLGGETFVTFDKKASKILERQGRSTKLLAS
jgi:predicted nucleic-acid-binding protein